MRRHTVLRWWFVGCLLPWLLASGAGGVEILSGPEVEAGTNRAVIRWEIDVAAGARVRFGVATGSALDGRAEGPVNTRHAVTLENLKPATKYRYTVGTARWVLATNEFTTAGSAVPGVATGTNSPAVFGAGAGTNAVTASPPGTAGPTAVAPPARETWGSYRTLADHFERHGADFGARDAEDYARQAWAFRRRAYAEGLPAKRDADGTLRVFDPKTGAFAAYNRNGTTKTYFKPGRRNYFADQPGRPVDLKQEKP